MELSSTSFPYEIFCLPEVQESQRLARVLSITLCSHSMDPLSWLWSLVGSLATTITPSPDWFCINFCFILVEKMPDQCAQWWLSSGCKHGALGHRGISTAEGGITLQSLCWLSCYLFHECNGKSAKGSLHFIYLFTWKISSQAIKHMTTKSTSIQV